MALRIPVVGDQVLVGPSDPYYAGDRGVVVAVEPERYSQHQCRVRFTDGGEDLVYTARLVITKDAPGVPPENQVASPRSTKPLW